VGCAVAVVLCEGKVRADTCWGKGCYGQRTKQQTNSILIPNRRTPRSESREVEMILKAKTRHGERVTICTCTQLRRKTTMRQREVDLLLGRSLVKSAVTACHPQAPEPALECTLLSRARGASAVSGHEKDQEQFEGIRRIDVAWQSCYMQWRPKSEEVSKRFTPLKENLQTKAPANARHVVWPSSQISHKILHFLFFFFLSFSRVDGGSSAATIACARVSAWVWRRSLPVLPHRTRP
jgi:hypothetical protein